MAHVLGDLRSLMANAAAGTSVAGMLISVHGTDVAHSVGFRHCRLMLSTRDSQTGGPHLCGIAVTARGLPASAAFRTGSQKSQEPSTPTLTVPPLYVFSLCSLWPFQNKCVWNLPQLFHFSSTVCQPDNSRHVIQGLVKCFIQQSFCYINYSYSTAQSKLHFDYTVILQSIHSPDGDHGRSGGHTCEWIVNVGSSPLCPQLAFLVVSSLSRAL